ncbi:NUDIX hydrolase [Peribacillus sp. SCS-155]|uniref:NUDIX hydrolase n=1 Tax=Peribacillus sedimenti TaxID=3115297 RepID=UPI003905BEA8
MGYIMDLRKIVGNRPIIMVGASVICLDQSNRLLLQLRTDNGYWALPGGSMEPGETLEEVAARELFEEAGLVANSLELFKVYSGEELHYKYPHGDEVYNVTATYICTDYKGEMIKDSSEVSDLQFCELTNLPLQINPPDLPAIKDLVNSFSN